MASPSQRVLPTLVGGPLLFATVLLAATSSAEASRAQSASTQSPRFDATSRTAVLTAQAFGVDAHFEIEPLDDRALTRDALAEALAAVRSSEGLLALEPGSLPFTAPSEGGVADLNRQAGIASVSLDPELFALLERALDFCRFSEGAFGPLGAQLIRLWGLRQPVTGRPTLAALELASSNASCNRLLLEPASHSATLAAGSQVDLLAFERAFAVDRAIDELRARGASNGWVQIGRVARAFGGGPDGNGWPILVDATNPVSAPTERVLLRDRSIALAAAWLEPIEIAGDREAPYLDHRTGRPASGTIAVLTVTETAIDAAGLAASLFVMPQRVGQFRLGALKPPPAVKWFLGDGNGTPLVAERGWAELPKWQPPKSPFDR